MERISEWTQLWIVSQIPHSGFLKVSGQCSSPEWEYCYVRKAPRCSFCLYTIITALQSFHTNNIWNMLFYTPAAFFQILFLAITRLGYCWQHVYLAFFFISFFSFMAMPFGFWDFSSPVVEPQPSAVIAPNPNHWTTRELLTWIISVANLLL